MARASRRSSSVLILSGLFATASAAITIAANDPPTDAPTIESRVLSGMVKSIDGKDVDLAQYAGQVVLIVNVASKCGYTPQYESLQVLYESKKDAGFVVLGFPANDFGSQEPGTNTQIMEFCSTKFGVTFPMFEKVAVKGEGVHPLYAKLAALPAPVGGEPKWNFTKFLIDRSGNVVARYEPKIKPDDPTLITKIDSLLAAKP